MSATDWRSLARSGPVASDRAGFIRFALVGASNTLITLATYTALVAFGVAPVAASVAGFCVGAASGYRANRAWTFRGAQGGRAIAARYVVAQLAGLGLNAGGVWLLVAQLGAAQVAGELAILPVVTMTTFLLLRHWVFPTPPAH